MDYRYWFSYILNLNVKKFWQILDIPIKLKNLNASTKYRDFL